MQWEFCTEYKDYWLARQSELHPIETHPISETYTIKSQRTIVLIIPPQ
jgi:hypothetical protein